MIRVLLVDDHPALRAGLSAVLRSEPGIVPLGTAGSAGELWPALHRTRPDLVLLDYHLLPDDGLALDDTPPTEIAQVLGIALCELDARLDAMLGRLRVEVAAPQ